MSSLLAKIGMFLYRVWFYILVALPILVFFPLLVLTTLSPKTFPQFFWLARNLWAPVILYGMGCPPRISHAQAMKPGKSYMLVANHSSMLDIMLMLRVSRNPFVFVGKKELVEIPVFGYFYKRVCIMVDRSDHRSRMGVYRRAQRKLDAGLSICIFPEGGVPDEEVPLDDFKDGAFKMAIAHKIPIVPMTFYDVKQRFPFSFFKGGPGPIRIQVHPFVATQTLGEKDMQPLKQAVRTLILKSLEEDSGVKNEC